MRTSRLLVPLLLIWVMLGACSCSLKGQTEKGGWEDRIVARGRISQTAPLIRLEGPVTSESVSPVIRSLRAAEIAETPIILLEINSLGGSVPAGFELVKAIERSPVEVHCIVDGFGASMAFYLLQSCETRSMTKRSVLMVHEPSVAGLFRGDQRTYRDLRRMLQALADAMMEHMAHRMSLSVEELKEKLDGGDWWIGWKESLETGAVDSVADSVDEFHRSLGRR